jgi:hypothetical protein
MKTTKVASGHYTIDHQNTVFSAVRVAGLWRLFDNSGSHVSSHKRLAELRQAIIALNPTGEHMKPCAYTFDDNYKTGNEPQYSNVVHGVTLHEIVDCTDFTPDYVSTMLDDIEIVSGYSENAAINVRYDLLNV